MTKEKQDEYAILKNDFALVCERGFSSFQESTPGREIDYASFFLGSRWGTIAQTNDQGIPQIITCGVERDNTGNLKRQRFFIGLRSEVATKDVAWDSQDLKGKDTIIKEFKAVNTAYGLMERVTDKSQKAGSQIQRKIDEEGHIFFPFFHIKGKDSSASCSCEEVDLLTIKNLMALARQVTRERLGAKMEKCDILVAQVFECSVIADHDGNKVDGVLPLFSFVIQVKTTDGNVALGTIRGAGGGMEILLRDHPERSYEDQIRALAENVAKDAIDMDRAQGTSILGSECPVIFSSHAAGVLAHECYGHCCLTEDRYLPMLIDGKFQLKQIGKLWEEYSQGESEVDLSTKDIRVLSTSEKPDLFHPDRLRAVLSQDQLEYITDDSLYDRKNVSGYNIVTTPKVHGEWKRVLAVMQRPNKPVRNIWQKGGETICTDDHRIITYGLGKFDYQEAQDLNKSFVSVVSIPKMPITQPADLGYTNEQVMALMKVIGAFVSEGSYNRSLGAAHISNTNKAWLIEIEKAAKIADPNATTHIRLSSEATEKHKACYRVEIFSKRHGFICQLLEKECCGAVPTGVRPCRGKRLPNWVFQLSDEYLRILLKTMIEGDGYSYRKRASRNSRNTEYTDSFQYCTTSQALAAAMSIILTKLSIRYSIDINKKRGSYSFNTIAIGFNKAKVVIHNEPIDYSSPVYDLRVEGTPMFTDGIGLILVHNSEADLIVENRRSKTAEINLKGRIGGQVSDHPRLTMVDDGNVDVELGGTTLHYSWGATINDERGTSATRALIIDRGVMVGAMVDRYTFNEITNGLKDEVKARMLEAGLSGNVRSEKFDQKPQIRMTCTAFLADSQGPKSLAEVAAMIPKTKKGVYVHRSSGGWVNTSTGDFAVVGAICYLIENGQVTDKPIKEVTISGNIGKFGSQIKAVGSVETIDDHFSGVCGKNSQWTRAAGCSPIIYVENAKIGGGSGWNFANALKEYTRQSRQFEEGKRDSINIREVEEVHGVVDQSQLCMIAECLPIKEEEQWLLGSRDSSKKEVW